MTVPCWTSLPECLLKLSRSFVGSLVWPGAFALSVRSICMRLTRNPGQRAERLQLQSSLSSPEGTGSCKALWVIACLPALANRHLIRETKRTLPTSGSPPAPNPRVSFRPIWILLGASTGDVASACRTSTPLLSELPTSNFEALSPALGLPTWLTSNGSRVGQRLLHQRPAARTSPLHLLELLADGSKSLQGKYMHLHARQDPA